MRRPSFTWVRWCRTIVGGHLSRFRVFLPGRRRKRRRSNNNHDRDVALTDGCSCFWAARLLFWPELWGAGDEVGDDVTGPPTAPSADPPGEWLLADPLPISLPLPDGPPLVELLDADNVVLDPMLNVPAVLLLLFFFCLFASYPQQITIRSEQENFGLGIARLAWKSATILFNYYTFWKERGKRWALGRNFFGRLPAGLVPIHNKQPSRK